MKNLVHTLYKGEVGKIIEFNDIEDALGKVDLTDYTVTMNLERNSTITVNDAAVTKRNQTTDRGDAFHQWDATTANIAVGEYLGNLKLTLTADPTKKFYWPCDADGKRTYFKVIVRKPID